MAALALAPNQGEQVAAQAILLLVLIVCACFFTGSEAALSYCNRIRIKTLADDGEPSAKRLQKILDEFDRALVTLLIGTNILYVSASSVATLLAVSLFGSVGSVIASVALTLITFILCETLPKNICKTNCDSAALLFSRPIRFFMILFTPLAWIFTQLGNLVKHLFGKSGKAPSMTEDEFTSIVEAVVEEGVLKPDESNLVKSAVEFSDLSARDVMTPLDDIVALEKNAPVEEIKRIMLDTKFSRIPVYDRDIDRIVGILQTKEAMWYLINEKPLNLAALCTEPYFVHPDSDLNELFEEMGRLHTHIAIVKSDNDRTLGLVTMEDILTEIVGELQDEDEFPTDRPSGAGTKSAEHTPAGVSDSSDHPGAGLASKEASRS